MSLPARQQRALDRIDQTLAVDDPLLGSMFEIFSRLTLDEPMPVTERVTAGLKRVLRPAMVISIALIAGLTVLLVSVRPTPAAGVASRWPNRGSPRCGTAPGTACPARRTRSTASSFTPASNATPARVAERVIPRDRRVAPRPG